MTARSLSLAYSTGRGSKAWGAGILWGSIHRRPASPYRLEQLASSIPGREPRMASLVLKMSVSLDGYVTPIDGSTDWIVAGGSDDALSWTVETVSNAGTTSWVPPPTR